MVFKLSGYQLAKYGLILLVLVLGWYGGWWDGLITPVVQPKTAPAKPNVPGINLYKTKLTGWDKHKKAWEIEAKQIWQSSDGNITYFEKIDKGIIFAVKGQTAYFKAGWARWEKPWSVLYIGGNLTVTVDRHEFRTKEVIMRFQNQELSCEYPIEVKGPDITLNSQ
ncbi:MAG TPA: LPS export ABC transporter periplasmic protein LptC, partial [Bacillota bacterium]|nr:LPS export ABC transporter periplasmic protein LptC [Bacillota bacterium]